jgi:hypothetical protein
MDPTLSVSKKSTENAVSFSKLISLNSAGDKCYMYFGWFFAFFAGLGMPLTFIIFGDAMKALGSPGVTPEDNFDMM